MHGNDVLSAVLERTGLHGRVYCHTRARAPWGLRFRGDSRAMFHIVLAGSCWLTVGAERTPIAAGDVVLLPRGAGHALSDAPKSAKIDLEEWLAGGAGIGPDGGPSTIGGDEGPVTEVLCGIFAFSTEASRHPVLERLPDLLHLRSAADLAGTLASLRAESDRGPRASALVVSRLLDVLFVQIVRAWVESAPPGATGWIGALDDGMLARAIGAVHDDPLRAWTVDALARLSGTSRATLARRFVKEVGQSPLAYVTRVRLEAAAEKLVRGNDGLAAIAAETGYATEFAFARAFRRSFGEPPGQFRERRRSAG